MFGIINLEWAHGENFFEIAYYFLLAVEGEAEFVFSSCLSCFYKSITVSLSFFEDNR